MGRGKRTQVALSDSQRRRRLPLIDTTLPASERELLVQALIDQLGLTFDRFTHPPDEGDRYLFFLSAPDYKGDPFCALDRSFPDERAAEEFYLARMDDPDDPNPLPQLVLDLDEAEPHFVLIGWDRNGFDLITGDETIPFGPGLDAAGLYAELERLD